MADEPQRTSLKDLLLEYGISSDFAQKVRFRGPVGKLALIGIVCLTALSGVGVRSADATVQIVCISLAAIITLSFGGAIVWYSAKFPDQATLEGMEVVVMHRQKAWAAKGGMLGSGGDSAIIPNPGGAPPETNPEAGADQ